MLAHELARRRPDWQVRSAGVFVKNAGTTTDRAWRALVPEWSEPHSSKAVTLDDIAWADLVVATSVQQARAVMSSARPGIQVVLKTIPDPNYEPRAAWPQIIVMIKRAAKSVAEGGV